MSKPKNTPIPPATRPTSEAPPAQRVDMVPILAETRERLKESRYGIARSCEDLAEALDAAQFRKPYIAPLFGKRKLPGALALLAALLVMTSASACAPGAELELEADAGAEQLEAPPELEADVAQDSPATPADSTLDDVRPGETDGTGECADASTDPILYLPAHRCAGHWADNSDSSTRYTAHPDTGLCTFACVWEDPRCDEAWFGDPRCFPAYAAVLGGLCAELGGRCELDASRSNRYCVAP